MSGVLVYRFWSAAFNNAHFFTVSQQGADHIRAVDTNWAYEGEAFGAYAAVAGACPGAPGLWT